MEDGNEAAGGTENISEFTMLNPVSKKAMYLVNIIMLAFLVAACTAITFFIPESQGIWGYVLWILAAIAIIYLLLAPVIFYKYYRYRMDDDCIETRSGVIFRSHVLVPVERVHQVEVNKGPVLRKFGLAKVTVTTAGGVVTLEYLDEPVAEDIASHLNEKIIKLLKARE